MSTISLSPYPPLEVKVMFEPHRLQHDVLRQAYACLIPETRRPRSSGKPASESSRVQSTESAERKKA